MGIVSSVNHTLSHEVNRIRFLMKNLLEEVKKHVVSFMIALPTRVLLQFNFPFRSCCLYVAGAVVWFLCKRRDYEEKLYNILLPVFVNCDSNPVTKLCLTETTKLQLC